MEVPTSIAIGAIGMVDALVSKTSGVIPVPVLPIAIGTGSGYLDQKATHGLPFVFKCTLILSNSSWLLCIFFTPHQSILITLVVARTSISGSRSLHETSFKFQPFFADANAGCVMCC